MRIGNQQNASVLLLHSTQKVQSARQVADAVIHVVVELHDVDAEPLTPVIQAIPFEIALYGAILVEQMIAGRRKRHAMGGCVAPRHQVPPDVIIEGEVKYGAIHIEHQSLTTLQCGFRIDIHCYTARPENLQDHYMDLKSLIEPVVALAEDAGRAILAVYSTDFEVQSKSDESPLTQADLASNRCIVAGLNELTPDIPIISEESGLPDFEERRQWNRYWLIDPLDGTKEFVNRNGEFTVNIAFIENNRPIFGVVHVPVQDKTYVGCEGAGAELRDSGAAPKPIQVTSKRANSVRVVGSRSHRGASLDAYLSRLGEHDMIPMGSSLKFCVIAEGRADLYPRLGLTSEWDTAAAQAAVEQAGGRVVTLDGKPLEYNTKSDILNPHFFVIGGIDRDWLALLPDTE